MKDWKNLLRGGFAYMEAPFAVHPLDDRRARNMVYLSKAHKVTLKEILDEATIYLTSINQSEAAIQEQLDRVKRYYKSAKFQKKKKSAWVIYWSYSDKEFDKGHIISIMDSRKSYQYVADFVLQKYLDQESTVEEKVHYSSHLKSYPYQVEYQRVNGIPWTGSMTCGHNPFIVARIVKNLTLSYDDNCNEMIHWDNFTPNFPKL